MLGGSRGRKGGGLLLSATVFAFTFDISAQAQVANDDGITSTTSLVEAIVFTPPVVTSRRTDTFSTQIIGRLQGGVVFDQTFAAPFSDPLSQSGVEGARLAITTRGGPGVIIAAPVRTQRTETLQSSTATSLFTLNRTQETFVIQETFGPGTTLQGGFNAAGVGPCFAMATALPSTARPVCGPDTRSPIAVPAGSLNFNTELTRTFFVDESRTQADTYLIAEQYELNGTVVAIGTVHAAVQSGLYDQAGRLLRRMSDAGQGSLVAAPAAGRGLWGEAYAMRVRHGDRRDTHGFAGGFSFGVGDGVALGVGVDHGWIDIEMPGASETGDLQLTQLGAVARFERQSFAATVSATYGFGSAETERLIVGASRADYDVTLLGAGLDIGYSVKAGGWRITPVAGLDYAAIRSGGFTESDALALTAPRHHASRTRASAGVEIGGSAGAVQLSASARYMAILSGAERSLPVAFAIAPGTPLLMEGPREPDSMLAGVKARLGLGAGAALTLGYDGRFGRRYDGHAAFVALGLTF